VAWHDRGHGGAQVGSVLVRCRLRRMWRHCRSRHRPTAMWG